MNFIKNLFSHNDLCAVNVSSDHGPALAIAIVLLIIAFVIVISVLYTINNNRKNKINNSSASASQQAQTNSTQNSADTANRQEASAQPQQSAPQQTSYTTATKKSNHGFLKFLVAILIIGTIIFGAVKLIDCAQNPDNSDGTTNPFSRSANNNDFRLEQSVEASIINLKDSYIIVPYCDITNLQITFTYYDSSGKVLSSRTKDVGSVIENSSYTITVEHTFSELLSISKYSYSVTGGTVSYFK